MVQSLTPSTATVAEKISEELPLYKAPVPTKLEQPTVQPTKTFVAKKQNVPTKSSISAPKVGVIKPNMEIGIIDRALGAIGSIIPTSFGSLGTPAMAKTTPLVSPPAMSVPVSQAPVQSIQQSSKNITERLRSKLGVSIPAEALTGQALIETRGGKSTIGKFNFLNVTATPEQIKSGKYVTRKVEERLTPEQIQKYNKTEPWREIQFADKTLIDKKYGKGSYDVAEAQGKKWVKMNQAFASYDSMKEYEDAAVELFSRERYAKPLQSLSGSEITPKIFGETVGKAGFATADPKRYGETISSTASQLPNKIDSGQKTYIASITNKDLNTPMNSGTNVIAPQTNIITNNNQSNKQAREIPKEPYNNALFSILYGSRSWF
jgi:flagellum-specific peptidoglycan hydrolase FlgJ